MRSFREAVAYYDGVREIVRESAQRDFEKRISGGEASLQPLSGCRIRLGAVDPIAIAATWHPTLFPWIDLHAKFRADFKRYELAVWVGDDLQALCLGRPSQGPQNVTLHVLERRRGERSLLKGCAALIATDVAEAYAKVLDKECVRLKAPVAGAHETYRRLGFTDAGKIGSVQYMTRQVRP